MKQRTKAILIVLALGVISSIKAFSQKVDTVQVMMFYCDTTRIKPNITVYKIESDYLFEGKSHNFGVGKNSVPYVFWQYGYEVYKDTILPPRIQLTAQDNMPSNIPFNEGSYSSRILLNRLDADKKPLPKNIVVFQTIQL